jgi:hypothetical protein
MSATHNTFGESPELALQEVTGRRDPRDTDRCLPPFPGRDARDTSGFHQPRDPFAPDPDLMLEAQLGVDAWRPVHIPTLLVDAPDLLGQPRVAERPI